MYLFKHTSSSSLFYKKGYLHIFPEIQEEQTVGDESILTDCWQSLSIVDNTSSDGCPSLLCHIDALTVLPGKATPLLAPAINLLEDTFTGIS